MEKMAKYFCYRARTEEKYECIGSPYPKASIKLKRLEKLGKGEVEDQGNGCSKLPWIRGKGSNWQGIKVSQKLLNCQKTPEEIVSVNTPGLNILGCFLLY